MKFERLIPHVSFLPSDLPIVTSSRFRGIITAVYQWKEILINAPA